MRAWPGPQPAPIKPARSHRGPTVSSTASQALEARSLASVPTLPGPGPGSDTFQLWTLPRCPSLGSRHEGHLSPHKSHSGNYMSKQVLRVGLGGQGPPAVTKPQEPATEARQGQPGPRPENGDRTARGQGGLDAGEGTSVGPELQTQSPPE